MLGAALLLAVLYLPGHFLGSRLTRKGDGRFELYALRAAVSLALACPVLTVLALAGWFTVPAIVLAFGACSVGAFALGRGTGAAVRVTRWDAGGLALVLGSLALYARRPAEYVLNSRDPGVYTLFADRLARAGALLHHDRLVGAVASFHPLLEGKKYPGFYVYGQDLIVPQFFPGPFALLGFGNLVGRVWGSLYVVPLMGALSVGVAFALGRELFGRWAGALGAALLALSYAQVWWARHPASEVMTQLLVLAGLWLAVRFVRGGDGFSGVLAGLLLGGMMLVRVDAFLAAAALPVLFAYDLIVGRPVWRWLYPGVPLVAFAGVMLLYLNTVGARYLYVIYTEHHLKEALALWPVAAAVFAVLAGGGYYVRRRCGARIGAYLEVKGGRLAFVGGLCVAAVALWAYFVLPVPWESLPDGSRDFDAYRTQILVRLVWFTTPIVAVLGLVGFVLAMRRLDAARALLLGALLAFGALYAAVPNVAPDLPWATRRFVPAAFPALCLLAGHATVELGGWLGRAWRPRAGLALAGALAALALAWTLYTTLPILSFQELDGGVAAFEGVEREIPEGAEVVYMEMPEGYDVTASTFEYLYGRPVLPYDHLRFIRDVDDLEERGLLDDAVYVTTDGGPAPLVSGVGFRQVGAATVELPRLAAVEKELPTRKETLRLDYRVFRVEEGR
ncbi:MAG: glycosyltransferase family 39 protein [Actinomycetota bacterium]|nr:glycosyltransferase family 39 protein [Actinomycetota bacterium]